MTYALIAIILVSLELIYFRLSERFNIVDHPNERSSHSVVTLRGGGVIFPIAVILFWVFFGFKYTWFVLGLTIIGSVSFRDDLYYVSTRVRILAHFVAMILMFHQFGILNAADWCMDLIALVFCVGIVNAFNFMDGINGITGGYSLSVVASLMVSNLSVHFIDTSYLIVVGISLLIFCYFNFRKKARCFAGDVGSISIAFILIFALGMLILKTGDLSCIVFLAVYGVDVVLTIIHRMLLHEKLTLAHRKHAYQIMANELKIPHIAVSTGYMGLQLAISAGYFILPVNRYVYLAAVVVLLSVAYIVFMKKYYHLHETYLRSKE